MEALRKAVADILKRKEESVDTIEVQHILIAFAGTGTKARRSKEEAEKLTAEVYERVLKGENFGELVKKYTDDSPPGIYGMTQKGKADRSRMIFVRSGMVAAFGDIGYRLKVGEVGVAGFDEETSPYGWHIIKRTK